MAVNIQEKNQFQRDVFSGTPGREKLVFIPFFSSHYTFFCMDKEGITVILNEAVSLDQQKYT